MVSDLLIFVELSLLPLANRPMSSGPFPLLDLGEDQIDQIGKQEEDDAEGDGHIEISPARLHDRGCGEDPGVSLDVPDRP